MLASTSSAGRIRWERPLVSCLMVTRNRSKLARLNLESFLQQTWGLREMIIVDDSDQPENLAIHKSIRQIILPPGAGMGEKHNLAMHRAQGSILCYWDDDDVFFPKRLEFQLGPILNDRADITGLKRDHILKIPEGGFYKFNHAKLRGEEWLGNGLGIARVKFHDGTAMFRRDAIKGTEHPEWIISQKLQFLNGMIERGARPSSLPNQNHFVYVRHSTNTWNFREDLRLARVATPAWFPRPLLEAYKGAVNAA